MWIRITINLSKMIMIQDFSNQLHVRLYVADLLKDNIKDPDFTEQAERMTGFILNNSSLPLQPEPNMSQQEMFANAINMAVNKFGGIDNLGKKKEMPMVERKYLDYKHKLVNDPKSPDRIGVIVGYSTDFNSIIALCTNDSPKGVCKGDNDFVDWPEDKTGNGFFYISIEEVERQIN